MGAGTDPFEPCSGQTGEIDVSEDKIKDNPRFIECAYGDDNSCGTIHKVENEK